MYIYKVTVALYFMFLIFLSLHLSHQILSLHLSKTILSLPWIYSFVKLILNIKPKLIKLSIYKSIKNHQNSYCKEQEEEEGDAEEEKQQTTQPPPPKNKTQWKIQENPFKNNEKLITIREIYKIRERERERESELIFECLSMEGWVERSNFWAMEVERSEIFRFEGESMFKNKREIVCFDMCGVGRKIIKIIL